MLSARSSPIQVSGLEVSRLQSTAYLKEVDLSRPDSNTAKRSANPAFLLSIGRGSMPLAYRGFVAYFNR